MKDGRVLQLAIVSAAVAASVVALAAACASITGGPGGGGAMLYDCGGEGTTNALIGAGIFTDVVDDYTFNPYQVDITPGQTVCWEIIDGASHTITPTGGGTAFGGTIDANQRVVVDTFAVVGDYPYFCQVHTAQNMTGLIRVR